MGNPHNIDRPDIVDELDKFGRTIAAEHSGYLEDVVITSSRNGRLESCSLYLLAPAIRYEYKVIEINIESIAEAYVRFITLATGQIETYPANISQGPADISVRLSHIKSLGLFRAAIDALINRVNLKKEFRGDIASKIVIGQAKVALLKNGERINVGWIEVKDNKVWYYTGKGLRELWRPAMTTEELHIAEKLRTLPMEEKIAQELVAVRDLSDFEDIL